MYKFNLNRESRINSLFNTIIFESKNIKIFNELTNDIKEHFDKNVLLIYKKSNFFILKENFQLNVFIIENNNLVIKQYLNQYLNDFIETTLDDIKIALNKFAGIYIPGKTNIGYLVLNYDILINHLDYLDGIIQHELIHCFDLQQGNNWVDLLPKDDNNFANNYNEFSNKLYYILFKLNISYETLYYLTSKNEFEAFCTMIEKAKDIINLDKALDFNYLISVEFQKLSVQIRNLYIFIYVNNIFDKSGTRLAYIKENLN